MVTARKAGRRRPRGRACEAFPHSDVSLRDFDRALETSLKERGVWGIKAKPFSFGRRKSARRTADCSAPQGPGAKRTADEKPA